MAYPLWTAPAPLLLASTSATRKKLLAAAGIPIETEAPDIDERRIEAEARAAGAPSDEVAMALARHKAIAVSRRRNGRLVLGADQTLDCEGWFINKPADAAAAERQIAALAGRAHRLHSAVALARNGLIVAEVAASAVLTMRPLDDASISRYVAAVGEPVTTSVGGYQIEGLGIHLFEQIDGDHATILGLPLLPLLAALRAEGCLAG